MRHAHGLPYALLGVVSRNPEGIHGYALKRQCERLLGNVWQLSYGEIYRALERLADEGQIVRDPVDATSARKVYRITACGLRTLEEFVLTPPTDTPQPHRQEFAVKLLFATPVQLPEVLRMADQQRAAYLAELEELRGQRRRIGALPGDTFVPRLLIDGAEAHVRAELAWLDAIVPKLAARVRSGLAEVRTLAAARLSGDRSRTDLPTACPTGGRA